jgi:carbamoyltransferase
VLNTSFNVKDEPIVCTPRDALRCFFGTGMDVLAIGDCILEKPA